MLALTLPLFLAGPAFASDPLRLALWHSDLGRNGPGLLLHDIRRQHEDITAALELLRDLNADVLVLLDIDHDLNGVAVGALAATLGYAHVLAPQPNTGIQRGLDLDRDGRLAEPEDALGHGAFPGAGGIAVLSRWPLRLVADHTPVTWLAAAPDDWPRRTDGADYFTPAEAAILPLWSVGAFTLAVDPPGGPPLHLLAWHAAPPAFDGPERRNRLRNAAQVQAIGGHLAGLADQGAFVVIGNSNLDPLRGNGQRERMQTLLADPRLQDPAPVAPHPGLGRQDTATAWWPDGPGALRVSYVLPDARLRVLDSALVWSEGARHAAVRFDLAWPP